MSSPHDPNPYAPSRLVGEPYRLEPLDSRLIPTLGLLAVTLGGIVLSGAAFGMVLAGIMSLTGPSNAVEVVMLLPLGIITGGVAAGISGIPTVVVAVCLSAPLVTLSKGWLPHQARHYASVCGFLSGSSLIIFVGSGDPYSWLIAMVPGTFGAIGTRLFVRWVFGAPRVGNANPANRTLVEQSGNNVT